MPRNNEVPESTPPSREPGRAVAARRGIAPLLLAVASGALFAFSLPPHQHNGALGWFALTPLLVAVSHSRFAPRRGLYAFGLGLVTGVTAGAVQVAGPDLGNATLVFALLPYLWIALVLGAVAALAASLRRHISGGGLRWCLCVAAAGVAVEWATTFSPLPVTVALSQSRTPTVLQIAALTGIWGVSFLLWTMNAAIADILLRGRKALPSLAMAVFFLAAAFAGGAARLALAPRPAMLRAAAIQDFSGADAPGLPVPTVQPPEKEDLIRDAAHRGARLIVGSEEAWGSAFTPGDPTDDTAKLAAATGAILVPGFTQRVEGVPGDDRSWNSAALVVPDGRTLGIHHKLFPFLGERQAVRPGERATAFATPLGRIGLLICFDNCRTGPARQCAQAGAQLIAQPNYDPPVPRATLHYLHAALTPFRAVENGIAIVRADPNGLSQIVDPYGRIVAETPMYTSVALVADVPLGDGRGTPFTRWGDWLAYGCVGACLIVAAPCRFGPRVETRARRPSANRASHEALP